MENVSMEKEECRMEQNLGNDYVYQRIHRKRGKSSRQANVIFYAFSGIFITIMKNLSEGQTFRREDDGCNMIDCWVKASKNHSKKGLVAIYREFPAQRLISFALVLKKRIFDVFSIYRLHFPLFICNIFLFYCDTSRRCFVPSPFCLFLLPLSFKDRIFLDKKLYMINDVGSVLVLLFQLLMMRLDLNTGPCPDQHRNLLEDLVGSPRSLTFHQL